MHERKENTTTVVQGGIYDTMPQIMLVQRGMFETDIYISGQQNEEGERTYFRPKPKGLGRIQTWEFRQTNREKVGKWMQAV